MKVTVVGAGIMGMSVSWALERDGHQVSVYDQGEIPNPLGSSVGVRVAKTDFAAT